MNSLFLLVNTRTNKNIIIIHDSIINVFFNYELT